MTPLRLQMTEDMRTAGLAAGTQAIYLDGVRRLAAHYRRSPDELSEAEVRAYLLGLRERGVALGTFKTNHGGIQFLYRRTLDRDWPLFGKKKDPPAEAAAPASRSVGRPDPCSPGLYQEPGP
jgi:integrase-like protein